MSDNNTNTCDAIKELYKLWAADNAIANQKLSMYFIAQGVLVNALNLVHEFLSVIPWLGIIISVVWLFSIARTQVYRDFWKESISDLTSKEPYQCLALFPNDESARLLLPEKKLGTSYFDNLISFCGKVPSKIVLVGSPILGLLLWSIFLLNTLC